MIRLHTNIERIYTDILYVYSHKKIYQMKTKKELRLL